MDGHFKTIQDLLDWTGMRANLENLPQWFFNKSPGTILSNCVLMQKSMPALVQLKWWVVPLAWLHQGFKFPSHTSWIGCHHSHFATTKKIALNVTLSANCFKFSAFVSYLNNLNKYKTTGVMESMNLFLVSAKSATKLAPTETLPITNRTKNRDVIKAGNAALLSLDYHKCKKT